MANSYTSVPNIIPGNLQVQGNLTVAGSQIKLGALARKYRIQEVANGSFVESVNLDRLAVAQDDATSLSQVRQIIPVTTPFTIATQAAGVPATDNFQLSDNGTQFLVYMDELRVGAATPYARIMRQSTLTSSFSGNLQKDLVTRDDVTKYGYALTYNQGAQVLSSRVINLAGVANISAIPICIWADYAGHTFTGSTVVQSVSGHTIRAGTLAATSGVYIRLRGSVITVAGGSMTVALYFGAAGIASCAIGASLNGRFVVDAIMINRGATNSQLCAFATQTPGQPVALGADSAAVDSTIDQTVAVQSQAGNVGDTVTFDIIDATLITNFTPT
jgi:hypothetical protein